MRIVVNILLTIGVLIVTAPKVYSAVLDLSVQKRDSSGTANVSPLSIDPAKTAIVVIDMWDSHPDSGWLYGAQALIPRMNQTFDVARQLGMQILWSPSNVVNF